MAQMKTLNGYEIVDETARNTKQNKVLYGSSDPSNTLGSNGDLYITTNGVDVINDLQNQINTNKNNIAAKVDAACSGVSFPFIYTFGNLGTNPGNMVISLSIGEQILFLVGAGSGGTYYITHMVAGDSSSIKHIGNNLTVTTNGNIITIACPSWFRGMIFSYLPFSVSFS